MTGVLLAAALGIALLVQWAREHRRQLRERAAFFDDCDGLLEAPRLLPRAGDLPLLEGRYRGIEVHLEPLVEAVALRKLPSLWLLVTVRAPTGLDCAFDLMMRSANVEFWSPAAGLEWRVETPPAWPEQALLRSDRPEVLPPLAVFEPHLDAFHGPREKELLATPRGVRLVRLLDEGRRGTYLLLRQAEFEVRRLPPETARDLLDRCLALRADLLACQGAAREAA